MIADIKGRYTSEDQRFFFPANHESVGTPEYCGEEHPQVQKLGRQVVAVEYESVDGTTNFGLQEHLSWFAPLPMGARLNRLFTVQDYIGIRRALTWSGDEGLRQPDQETDLEVTDEDTIIWKAAHVIQRNPESAGYDEFVDANLLFTQPAFEALPLHEGVRVESMQFEPLGLIKPEGKLITWRGDGESAQDMVELAVAVKEARNRLELALIQLSVGHSSLAGCVQCSDAAEAYLGWYDERKGTEFSNVREPRDRMDDYPELTPKQYRRYEKLQAISNAIVQKGVPLKF